VFLYQYPDATGLMGQFCMGNEPSFHIPYLYNYCGQAYKTQRKIHELIDLWFKDSPLGICGDEDGGAMSAFLVFSAMGFYPVNPCGGEYVLGAPQVPKTTLRLPNGKTFTVIAKNPGGEVKAGDKVFLNGKELKEMKISHADILAGGELVFE
jgi:predicted alpha-1,2-mannosidase